MKILLTAKWPPGNDKVPYGGVQSWTATVAKELEALGHEVTIWGPMWHLPKDSFDFGIIANVGDTGAAIKLCKEHVVVSHGIIDAEKPYGDHIAFTSEEVAKYWKKTGDIIRQPIDLDFWKPAEVEKTSLVRFSYRGGLSFVKDIAEDMDLDYIHLRNSDPVEVKRVLQSAKYVLATGRAALEAMACGSKVLLCDHRSPYQKALVNPLLMESMMHNYSGRGEHGTLPTRELVEELLYTRTREFRHLSEYHNSRQVVEKLICSHF